VFTAKHADGFCLWQTDTTDFGVRSSPWKEGNGDVLREIADAAAEARIEFGVYLSPADAHFGAAVGGVAGSPEEQRRYDAVYRTQLEEILTRYGTMCEVWFDGSCVTPVGDLLARHAPDAMVFQSANATIRWVGNEKGYAPYPAWNCVDAAIGRSGTASAKDGDPDGDLWLPLEVDTTIRDHFWMWEPDTDDSLKSLDALMEIYYRSVGHGAVLLLNSNPDQRGLVPEQDAARAAEFGAEINRRFGTPSARVRGEVDALDDTSRGLVLDLERTMSIDHVITREDIAGGEAVRRYHIQGLDGQRWLDLAHGTAIGHKKIDAFPETRISTIRVIIEEAVSDRVTLEVSSYSCGTSPPNA
jgi:alpha-L-fucosidase